MPRGRCETGARAKTHVHAHIVAYAEGVGSYGRERLQIVQLAQGKTGALEKHYLVSLDRHKFLERTASAHRPTDLYRRPALSNLPAVPRIDAQLNFVGAWLLVRPVLNCSIATFRDKHVQEYCLGGARALGFKLVLSSRAEPPQELNTTFFSVDGQEEVVAITTVIL